MNTNVLVDRAAHQFPSNVAVKCHGTSYTYAEVNERANRLANGLLALGLQKGDRVGLLVRNCAEYLEIEFGLAKAGLVAAPMNVRLALHDFGYISNDAGISALIFDATFAATVRQLALKLDRPCHLICLGEDHGRFLEYERFLSTCSGSHPEIQVDEDDLHTLMYTSGTTGRPKGVMQTHRNRTTVTFNLLMEMGPHSQADCILHVAPLTHGTGMFLLPYFTRGACSIVLQEFTPQLVCETVERERVTVFKLVPTILLRLLAFPELQHYDLSSLHTIIYGASPMPPEKLKQAVRIFGNVFMQLYGQAEAAMSITVLRKEDHVIDGQPEAVRRLASAGCVWPTVELRVRDKDGADLGPGEVGEVAVRGDHVMRGYWKLPEETAEVLRDGWLYTRDMGWLDGYGYLYLVDRKSDMIISGGFNIYPREIEDVLHQHPAVQDVAVVGVPDEEWGEAVKALVVVHRGMRVSAGELAAFCKEHLPSFKKPKTIEFIDAVPRNAYGKPLRRVLRERYWQGFDRRVH
ncbi:MAG TPA: AMP-dependent synthetase [Chloroflexi bacterium]|nr:AMP-dependent synthetase [Chloroflexota bacterium]